MNVIKKYIYFEILGVILLLGFIFRLKGYLINPSMWLDESALGWNILNKDYLMLFHKLRFLQLAPPLFLVVTKLLVAIFDGYNHAFRCDMILRTIPFLCGCASMWLFYLVGRKVINSKWAVLAGVTLFAFNPVLINYSFEFKPYSVDVFCTLLAVYIFLKIDFKTICLRKIFKYGLILAVMPWFSFASAFVIFAGLVTLSFKKENPALFTSLLMPIFVSVFAYINIFIASAYAENSTGMINYWQEQFVKSDFSNIVKLHNQNLHYFFMKIPNLSFEFLTIIAIAGMFLLLKDTKFLYVFMSIFTLSTVIVASWMQYYPFSRRMVLFLIPLFLIYLVKIIDIKKAFIGWILMAFVLIPHFIFAWDFMHIKNLNKGDFARNMIDEMAKQITPNETIVLNGASNADFYYYNSFYKLKNKVIYLKPETENPLEIQRMLNTLKKGGYWLFMPYDYDSRHINIDNIVAWAYRHSKIRYEAHAIQSTLIRITIY